MVRPTRGERPSFAEPARPWLRPGSVSEWGGTADSESVVDRVIRVGAVRENDVVPDCRGRAMRVTPAVERWGRLGARVMREGRDSLEIDRLGPELRWMVRTPEGRPILRPLIVGREKLFREREPSELRERWIDGRDRIELREREIDGRERMVLRGRGARRTDFERTLGRDARDRVRLDLARLGGPARVSAEYVVHIAAAMSIASDRDRSFVFMA